MKPGKIGGSHCCDHRPLMIFLCFFLLLSLLTLTFHKGHCAEVTLAWDPVDNPQLAGYTIYYGTASGTYQWMVDVGNVTTYTLSNLTIGATYYAAATAFTTSDLESGYSNEVMFTVPSCTYTISPSSASFSASGGTGSVSITTPSYCNWTSSSGVPWITLNAGSGLGSGVMTYSVASNTASTSRTAGLTIAGNVFTINQSGAVVNYTITASAGTGGSISPSGQVSLQSGATQLFSIKPNAGYLIAGVTVDGVSQGSVNAYTFSNVQANHTISAAFKSITYTIRATSGTGGSISPNGTMTVSSGAGKTFTIIPNRRYKIANVVVDGVSMGAKSTYTFSNITANHQISASFSR
jgi:hypothetical protein